MWDLYLQHETLSYGLWNLVPRPGIEPGLPALGGWSLSHWTTGKSLNSSF